MRKIPRPNHTEAVSASRACDNPDAQVVIRTDSELSEYVQQAIERAHSALHNGNGPFTAVLSKPSALKVAILRAAHQLLDTPLVFEDDLAVGILGAEGEACLRCEVCRVDDSRPKGFRASMVVRSRLAEDEWDRARQSNVCQYVILGAGLDTFAYRNPNHDACRVFEVDLPDMMEWKRESLRMAGIEEPDSLTFVPTDFEHGSLAKALKKKGFDPNAPAFFSWLGVTFYLEEGTFVHTLRFIGSLPPGSGVVFDYAVQPNLLPPETQQAVESLVKRSAERGEPWKTFLDPNSLPDTLHTLGFTDVEDFDPEKINALYLSGRTDGMRKGSMTNVICARV